MTDGMKEYFKNFAFLAVVLGIWIPLVYVVLNKMLGEEKPPDGASYAKKGDSKTP